MARVLFTLSSDGKSTQIYRRRKKAMASEPIRDSAKNHLLTPEHLALIIIAHQPVQVNSISADEQPLSELLK
jgi:hypothetical protein